MELLITNILKSLIFPPGFFLLLLLLGLVLLSWRPLLAKSLLWLALIVTYLLSTPFVAGVMLQQLQDYPALRPDQIDTEVKRSQAGAIVVLSANRYRDAPEYGRDTVGDATLERVRYGAYLHYKTGLPLVVSGGHVLDTKGATLAEVMADALQHDFGVKQVWLEDRSHTTAENAIYTQQLLQKRGIDTIVLVTHAYHMSRAVAIFEKVGLKVVPAPTLLEVASESDEPPFMAWLPSGDALHGSNRVLHELAGRLWYWGRYRSER